MVKQNSIFTGVLIGMLAPIVAYLVDTYTNLQATFFAEKPIALYVLAALVNLIIIRFTYRSGKDALAKGVVLITFLAMLFLIFATKLKV